MKFGKIVDGHLEIAPTFIRQGKSIIYTNSVESYEELGYKPVVYTDPPLDTDRNGITYHWEDNGTCCKQVWEPIPLPSYPLASTSTEEVEAGGDTECHT